VFSPNGGKIAFVRRVRGEADIWVMRTNGTSKRQVTSTGFDELQPSFFPGGGSLLYTQFDGSREWTVFSIRLSGTRRMRQASNATFPIASPNGRWLAYTKTQDGVGGIRLKNRRSGRTKRLTTGSAQDLDFAPNSRRIVFTGQRPCRRGGNLRFAVLSVGIRDQGARILRRSCRRQFISPAWSPNGRRIVFAHKNNAGTAVRLRFRLGMMRPGGKPAGGAPRHRRGTNELGPAWQPRRRA
jgi:Tol biopolymer transport system component